MFVCCAIVSLLTWLRIIRFHRLQAQNALCLSLSDDSLLATLIELYKELIKLPQFENMHSVLADLTAMLKEAYYFTSFYYFPGVNGNNYLVPTCVHYVHVKTPTGK